MPSDRRPRVLIAILVYNGRAFVPRALESAARVATDDAEVDVLALDDCSPDPGWSEDLEAHCTRLGIGYYCSPRNVGIPRNMNLGLLRGLSAGYEHVIILNSDVILPFNLVSALLAVASRHDRVASVTAWSNNASIYSLPNTDPDGLLADPATVDRLSSILEETFGAEGIEIPTAVGFCMLIPTATVRDVGLFDPVFGRGYCEELDWSLRANAAGFSNLLATNAFVYHEGSATTREAGLLAQGETTVTAHEAIIDQRYPLFRGQVSTFGDSDRYDRLAQDAVRAVVLHAARSEGYELDLTSLRSQYGPPTDVRFSVETTALRGRYRGFEARFDVATGEDRLDLVTKLVGAPPRRINLYGTDEMATRLATTARERNLVVEQRASYPERV